MLHTYHLDPPDMQLSQFLSNLFFASPIPNLQSQTLEELTRSSFAHTPPPPAAASHQINAAAPAANFSFTPLATELVTSSRPGFDGLDYLMQSCTNMLKEKMGVPASPLPLKAPTTTHSEIAMDAVGPVLETVLINLTSEYEKRLLAKDQERKSQSEAIEVLRRQITALHTDVAHWREACESGAAAAAASAAAEIEALKIQERAEYDRLRSNEAALQCELSAKRRELQAAESSAAAAQAAASSELSHLQATLAHYRGLDERYKALRNENRQLYNTVQDLRGSIRVFCRVRPSGATGEVGAESAVEVNEQEGRLAAFSPKHNKWHEYKFDRVFGEDSRQEEIYQETKPLVRSVLDGYNVCIFAYGQTGSGKTHTMSGSGAACDGVNYRAFKDLFDQIEERAEEMEYTIRVQLVEIYNEVIRDLLGGDGDEVAAHKTNLGLVATRCSGSNLPDATQVVVDSAEEVAEVLAKGSRNRTVAETRMNARSSRSHQILTIIVEGMSVTTHARSIGCLHLIDLAGSERVSRSGATGVQLTEAQHINKSLTALGMVMQALAQKRDHIPFRDSKLTQLLADSLAGQAKSMMFMHVAPEESSVSESLSTLNFGRAVTEITLGAAKRNVVESGAVWEAREIKGKLSAAKKEAAGEREARLKLEQEVATLRAQVAESMMNRRNSSSLPLPSPIPPQSPTDSADDVFDKIPAHRPSPVAAAAAGVGGLARPPQVGRLNLSRLSICHSGDNGGTAAAPAPHVTPERRFGMPQSARLSSSGIKSKLPSVVSRRTGGSLTSRPSSSSFGAESKQGFLPTHPLARSQSGVGNGEDGVKMSARRSLAPAAAASGGRRWM